VSSPQGMCVTVRGSAWTVEQAFLVASPVGSLQLMNALATVWESQASNVASVGVKAPTLGGPHTPTLASALEAGQPMRHVCC
jgi:hypothetical protein